MTREPLVAAQQRAEDPAQALRGHRLHASVNRRPSEVHSYEGQLQGPGMTQAGPTVALLGHTKYGQGDWDPHGPDWCASSWWGPEQQGK